MTTVSNITTQEFSNLQRQLAASLLGCASLAEAAQSVCDSLYEELRESIVLVRVFGTVPYGDLPESNRDFVTKLASSHQVDNLLSDQTLVLSLLGTRGEKRPWNKRSESQGHIGIPLFSADFIEAIPMISRLLKELGLPLDYTASDDTKIVAKSIGKMAGLFYVSDAGTALDEKGRAIIPAHDFVRAHPVKSVFGFGGGYIVGGTFIVALVFSRESIDKSQAERFMRLVNVIKSETTSLVSQGKIFS